MLIISLYIAIGVLLGFIAGWLWASKGKAVETAQLKSQLEFLKQQEEKLTNDIREKDKKIAELTERVGQLTQETQNQLKNIEEQKQLLKEAQDKLKDAFNSLATETLKASKQDFLQLAKETLNSLMNKTKGDLSQHKEQIQAMIKPLSETLKNYQNYLREIEKERSQAYGNLSKHLEQISKINKELQNRTGELATALKNPQVGGKWGELTLRRTAELAGMSEYCDFDEQISADTETGRIRPDMIVNLPGGRKIAVDSKISYQSYIEAVNATDETTRQEAMRKYAKAVKTHVQQLSSKSYWEQFGDDSVEFVVLFLPGESFYSAAVAADKELIEYAINNRVVLSSPTTLIALLKAVAYGWKQEQFTQNTKELYEKGRELFDRLSILAEHLAKIGNSLNSTVQHYNRAVSSFETRFVPSARRFNELGKFGDFEKIDSVNKIDVQARQFNQLPISNDENKQNKDK